IVRVLERESVEPGRQPAIGRGSGVTHSPRGSGDAAKDVPAANHDCHLNAGGHYLLDLGGDAGEDAGIDPVLAVAQQRLPGKLEEDPAVAALRVGVGHTRPSLLPPTQRSINLALGRAVAAQRFGYLGGEIVLALLDSLADGEAGKTTDGDIFANFRGFLGDQ